jgi:hypothetical protein
MRIGLMWVKDDKKKPLLDSLKEALLYYSQKYGWKAESCYVNPFDFTRLFPFATELKVTIISAKNIPINYFWIGTEVEREVKEKTFTS